MQTKEKLLIGILIILTIVLVIFFTNKPKTIEKKITLNCSNVCHNIVSKGWTFIGAKPVGTFFTTKDECVSACESRKIK